MRIEAVILDRDGVLADYDISAAASFFRPLLPMSLEEISDAWEDWGGAVGFPRNQIEEARFFSSFWDSLSDEKGVSEDARQRLQQFKYTSYMTAFPDAFPMLVKARRLGLRIGVLSNFSLASLDLSLQVIGLNDLVDVALAAPVIGFSKPDSRAYLAIADALNVKPTQCLFFDNEVECVEGGRAVGMRSYLVDRGRGRHSLQERIVFDLSSLSMVLDNE